MLNWRKLLPFSPSLGGAFSVFLGLLLLAGCPGKPKYPACDGEKDCKPKERCVLKKCVQCGDNTHCAEGLECVRGACTPVAGYCEDDTACGVFEVCKNHKCTTCANDGECGVGGKCREGKCIRPGACERDEDCPEDQDCVNHRCVKLGGPSTSLPSCPLDPVFFGFDQYNLGDDAKMVLQKDYDCLQANKGRPIAVVGHTDSIGTIEYNISLSDDRAQAVITYLGRLGIDPVRMRKVPKGSAEAKGVDQASFAQDRRVEMVWE